MVMTYYKIYLKRNKQFVLQCTVRYNKNNVKYFIDI